MNVATEIFVYESSDRNFSFRNAATEIFHSWM
jgi:hypothetical protein